MKFLFLFFLAPSSLALFTKSHVKGLPDKDNLWEALLKTVIKFSTFGFREPDVRKLVPECVDCDIINSDSLRRLKRSYLVPPAPISYETLVAWDACIVYNALPSTEVVRNRTEFILRGQYRRDDFSGKEPRFLPYCVYLEPEELKSALASFSLPATGNGFVNLDFDYDRDT